MQPTPGSPGDEWLSALQEVSLVQLLHPSSQLKLDLLSSAKVHALPIYQKVCPKITGLLRGLRPGAIKIKRGVGQGYRSRDAETETRADGLLSHKGRTQPRRPEQITTESRELFVPHCVTLTTCLSPFQGLDTTNWRRGRRIHAFGLESRCGRVPIAVLVRQAGSPKKKRKTHTRYRRITKKSAHTEMFSPFCPLKRRTKREDVFEYKKENPHGS
ncbi:hypothetical protein NDU88_005463 [Pleurodeles waltl]|uniref:Uncharacterized protein n=1 Tax=Pleurodeles waltl TaxID=8319 RepID=A0AAV7WYR2_PLEWA|nr:hypothetical protein NDU88_005463 [Pleurodeles waltl]